MMAMVEPRGLPGGAEPVALRVRWSRWLVVSVVALLANVGVVVAHVAVPAVSDAVVWGPATVSVTVAAAGCLLAAREAQGAAGRFWRLVGCACLCAGFGTALTGYAMISQPSARISFGETPVADSGYVMAMALALWAMIGLPLGRRTRREWLTANLDMATVLLAATIFMWHFSFRPSLSGAQVDASVLTRLVLAGLEFVVLLAIVKVLVFGAGPVDHGALTAMGLAMLAGAVAGAIMPLVPDGYRTGPAVATSASCLLVSLATERQRQTVRRPHAVRTQRRRRPFSLLPYVAVAATGWLLLTTVRSGSGEAFVVAVVTVAIAALVVVRQIASFYDNAELVARLDRSLVEVRYQEQRLSSLMRNSSDIITVTAGDGTLQYASPGLGRLVGRPVAELLGGSLDHFIHPEDTTALTVEVANIMPTPGATSTFTVRAHSVDGGWRWFEMVLMNLLNEPGVNGIVANARDVTENRRYQAELLHQATHDALTNLANRTLLYRRTRQALAGGAQPGNVVMVLVDLDDFKLVNDQLGHAVGDELLLAVAQRLCDAVPPGNTVARLGGDEFAILLADVDARVQTGVLDRIGAALQAPVSTGDHQLLIRASIGVAHAAPNLPGTAVDEAELLRRADVAMYAAKQRGKGCREIYQPELEQAHTEHASIAAELAEAIAAGQLHLLYQPIVRLPDGRLHGVEALIRWRHPQRGLVQPGEFIPVAERTGLIVPLGRFVLRTACRQAADWLCRYGPHAPAMMSVNVAGRQLREGNFVADVQHALQEAGLAAERLIIEVTETAVFDDGPALATLHAVHDLGVRVALDDFGTGHSSLRLLRICPVDILKVDKSFVDPIPGTRQQVAIAASLADIAENLDLDAVAEGVETATQAAQLYQMGYRLAQGFHFARPLDPAGIEAFITADADSPADSRYPPVPVAPTR